MNRFRMSDRINRYWLFHFLLVYMEKLHFQISVLNWEKIFFKIENQESIQKLLTDYNSNILNIAVTRKTNKQCDITNTVGTFRLVEDTGKISLAKKRLFESSAAWDLSCMNMQHFRIRLLCVQTPSRPALMILLNHQKTFSHNVWHNELKALLKDCDLCDRRSHVSHNSVPRWHPEELELRPRSAEWNRVQLPRARRGLEGLCCLKEMTAATTQSLGCRSLIVGCDGGLFTALW